MNRIALLAAGCAVLALAACDHPDAKRQKAERALKVVTSLECPDKQGSLSRISATPETCAYTGDGAEVTLKLVKLNGAQPATVLEPIEAELKALMPVQPGTGETANVGAGEEEVSIKLPGISIEAGGNGAAKIDVAGAKINADEQGAQVRVERNVRVDGKTVESETHRRNGRDDSVMARFILASDKADSEWSVVGYSARGPKGGPLVVASLKAKDRDAAEGSDDLFQDIDELVRHNVGGRGSKHVIIR